VVGIVGFVVGFGGDGRWGLFGKGELLRDVVVGVVDDVRAVFGWLEWERFLEVCV